MDRGMKKWKPFNSVVPTSYLLKSNDLVKIPNLSKDQIEEYEELIKDSLYNSSKITILYLDKNSISEITDRVIKIDSITKSIILSNKLKINFRQIYKIK